MAKRHSLNTVSEDDSWRVESDLRTLTECEAIKKDPERMKKVRKLAKEKMLEVATIASTEEA